MKSYLYYLKYDGKYLDWTNPNYASVESDKRPLVVNCASCVNTPEPHKSINEGGRLDYLLMYIVEGTVNISTSLGNRVAHSGNLFVLPPKTSYLMECTGDIMYFLIVHFTGSEVLSKLKEYGINIFPAINRLNQKNHMQIRFKNKMRLGDILNAKKNFALLMMHIVLNSTILSTQSKKMLIK